MRIGFDGVKRIRLARVGMIRRMRRTPDDPEPVELLLVQRNLRDLIDREGPNLTAWSTSRKLLQSTVYRIATGKQDPTTSVLATIAEAIGLEPWQLVAPDLGAGLYRLDGKTLIPVPSPSRPTRGMQLIKREEDNDELSTSTRLDATIKASRTKGAKRERNEN